MDRSGEKNLNPYDTHAIEAAMQIREGGASVRVAVLRPELTTVWFERDSPTLSDAGARSGATRTRR